MSDLQRDKLVRLPREERDAMLAVAQGRGFKLFMEHLIQGRTAYLNESLDAFKKDSLLLVGKLLGERSAYSMMRDRILAFQKDIGAINDAEDKREEEAEKDSGKE